MTTTPLPSSERPLPPVEPPNTAFVVQLFVVPGAIVAMIVLVWTGFNWLASTPTDPKALVQAMRRDTPYRWQSAVALADLLRNPQQQAHRRDPALARELADLLARELDSGRTGEEDLQLRYYLCQALGKFEIVEGIPVLLRAADARRKDEEQLVCDGALEALASLAANFRAQGGLTDPGALKLIFDKSNDERTETRYRAAFALGQVGSSESLARLERMLTDADPHVCFNAATALAAHGRVSALDVLIGMLDPAELTAQLAAQPEAQREAQRLLILRNALASCGALLDQVPRAQLEPLKAALQKLLASDPPVRVKADATTLLNRFRTADVIEQEPRT